MGSVLRIYTAAAKFAFLIAALFAARIPAAEPLRIEQSQSKLSVKAGEQLVLAYNLESPSAPQNVAKVFERSGFLHPVLTPKGACVTAAFPADHEHQQGIFAAWTRTSFDNRNVDFWNLGDKTGRVKHGRLLSIATEPDRVSFEVELTYQSLGEPVVDVLREWWKLTVYATPGNYYCFDIQSRQTPLTEKPLLIEKYIYGGQAFRGPVAWLETSDEFAQQHKEASYTGAIIRTSEGKDRFDGNHTHVRWVAISGDPVNSEGSRSNALGKSATIAVLAHPNNYRFPQAVRLHPTKPYFCFAPCIDGPFAISQAEPYENCFRYLVTSETIDAHWIDEQWKLWVNANGQ